MEDRANQARGHKAALSNPNVSNEAKQHSCDVLKNEFDNQTSYKDEMDEDKDKTRVAAGLKAAMHNPRVTEEGRQHAEERLDNLQ